MSVISIEGLDPVLLDLSQRIREFGGTVEAEAAQMVQARGRDLFATVQSALPQGKTGNLRAGLAVRQIAPLVVRVKGHAPHTHLIEDGWHHTHAGRPIKGRHIIAKSAIEARARLYAGAAPMLERAGRVAGLDVR